MKECVFTIPTCTLNGKYENMKYKFSFPQIQMDGMEYAVSSGVKVSKFEIRGSANCRPARAAATVAASNSENETGSFFSQK